MDEHESDAERLNHLIQSAVNPKDHYRRAICRRLASQTFHQFGVEGLMDLLTGVDDIGKFQSVIVADRDEIDNYVFEKYGIFDPDMMEKIQMSDKWDSFLSDMLAESSKMLGEIIKDVIESERN